METPYLVRSHTFATDEQLQNHLNECYYAHGFQIISIFKDGAFYTIVSYKL